MNRTIITSNMITQMTKQSLKSSRMRNTFVMITIILAASLLAAILMFAAGQKQRTKNDLSHRQQASYYNLTDEQVRLLANDGRLGYQIRVKSGILSQMDGYDIMPFYVNELSDQIQIGELLDGSLPEAENEIAVQAALLNKMGIAPSIGSSVTFSFYDGCTEAFTVSGILKGSDTVKQFSVFFSESYAQNGSQLKNMPYEVHARLYDVSGMSAADCKETIYLIGSEAGIERKNINPSKAFLDSLSVNTQSVMIYGLAGSVILLACILVIYGVFYLSVIGRVHQFGQLRTIGMTRKQIKKFVSKEGRLLYIRSAPLGIIIGTLAGYLMIPDGFHLLNSLIIAALVSAIVYIVTMISIRRPARLAASVSPMEALRYVPQDGMKKTAGRKMCRSLTPLGLGMMNFSKNRKKTVITMLSLALGGILFMTAAVYMTSFNRDQYSRQGYFKDAEFHITYSQSAIELNEYGLGGLQAETPLGDELINKISELDGVKKIQEIKRMGLYFDCPKNDVYNTYDVLTPLAAEKLNDLSRYLESGSAEYEKLISGDYILAADNDVVEEVYGWRFAVGDQIIFHYYDGSKMAEKAVTILGILNQQYIIDHGGLDGWFLMPEQAIAALVPYENLNTDLLISAEPEKEAAVGESLINIANETTVLDLSTLADKKAADAQATGQIFGAISGLGIFIMMFSILSMINTLITNIVTRKQELSMLESIGMTKGQIRKMLLSESLLLITITVGVTMTIGTLCGYALSSLLYKNGAFYMAFRFPTVLALAYAGVLTLVPLMITFVSMHSFSKEVLADRLRGAEI